MMRSVFDGIGAEIGRIGVVHHVGRIAEVAGSTLRVSGLGRQSALGDRVVIRAATGTEVGGEILRLTREGLTVLPEGPADGLCIGDAVTLVGRAEIAPDDSWIGRIIDPFGRPLDGKPLFRGAVPRPLRAAAPAAAHRKRLGQRLETGVRVFNTLLPLVRGQRLGLFAGSGVGKSTLLGRFARGVAADVVVIALIGERGRELREFSERTLGKRGMARSVIIAATSDQSPLIRRRCGWTAMAVADAAAP